jgi:hypothetical protein
MCKIANFAITKKRSKYYSKKMAQTTLRKAQFYTDFGRMKSGVQNSPFKK